MYLRVAAADNPRMLGQSGARVAVARAVAWAKTLQPPKSIRACFISCSLWKTYRNCANEAHVWELRPPITKPPPWYQTMTGRGACEGGKKMRSGRL